jgi:CheY-like chemotaxis protein
VLLVEDNPDDEQLATRALRRYDPNLTLEVARDGQEALNRLLESSEDARLPDLVLLDLKLPKVDGIEVLERVRKADRTALLPIVVLTSSDERRDVLACYQRGVNSYVRKPVEYDEYIRGIGEVAAYWLSRNTSAVE